MEQISGMKLDKLIEILQQSIQLVPRAAAEGAMRPLMGRVSESFAHQRDPSGKTWDPLKYKKLQRGHKILEGLKPYFSFFSYGTQLKVSNQKYYTKYHHTGTKHMARRGFLPESGKPVSRNWDHPLRLGAQKAIISTLKRMGMR